MTQRKGRHTQGTYVWGVLQVSLTRVSSERANCSKTALVIVKEA